jgi:hypothetical protein
MIDIEGNEEIRNISIALKNANDKLNAASQSGDQQAIGELSNDIGQLQSLYAITRNTLEEAKNSQIEEARSRLASSYKYTEPPASGQLAIAAQEPAQLDENGLPLAKPVNVVTSDLGAIAGESKQEKKNSFDIRADLANVLQVDEKKVDVDNGLTSGIRAKLSFQRTPEEKLKFLQDQYGFDNVTSVNVSGNPSFVVKQKDPYVTDSNTWVLADELGSSFNDFTSDIVGELPTIAGNIVGGLVGAGGTKGLKGGGSSKYAGPELSSAIGGFIAGSAQDAITRIVSGSEINPAEIVKSRGIDAMVGLAIDKVGKFAGKPLMRMIGKSIPNEMSAAIANASSLLRGKGIETSAPIMNVFGKNALERQQVIMGQRPSSSATTAAMRTIENLNDFKKALIGEPVDVYGRIVNTLKDQEGRLISHIATQDESAAQIVKSSLDKKVGEMTVTLKEKASTGNLIREELVKGKDILKKAEDDVYNNFFAQTDQAGLRMSRKDVADILESGLDKKSQFSNSGVTAEISRLRGQQDIVDKAKLILASGKEPTDAEKEILALNTKLGGDLGMGDVNDIIRVVKKAVPSGGVAGTNNTSSVAAQNASMALRNVRDGMFGGANLTDAWVAAQDNLKNALGTKAGAVGRSLRENYMVHTKTGDQVVDDILSDPTYIKDAIDIAATSSKESGNMARQSLQNSYLASIGLDTNKAIPVSSIDYNIDKIRALWGSTDTTGAVDFTQANNIKSKLDMLNKSFEQAKIPISKVSPDQVKTLLSTLNADDTRLVMDNLMKSARAQTQKDLFASNSIIKAAKDNAWDITGGDQFTEAMYGASIPEIRNLMKRLPGDVKPSIQSNFAGQLFKDYPSEVATTSGTSMWNASKVLKDLKGVNGNEMKNRISTVMGKEWLDDFTSASVMLEANSFKEVAEREIALKTSVNKSRGATLFVAANLADMAKTRVMSGLQGAGMLQPMFKAMARDVGLATSERRLNRLMFGLTSTRAGITALSHATANDPDAAQSLVETFKEIGASDAGRKARIEGNLKGMNNP